jgi:hypothetical protein
LRKFFPLVALLIATLACAIPGIPTPEVASIPSFDPNSVSTIIAETAAAAQTQTSINLPTATNTPRPTHTPSITPTFTPTFIFFLPSLTPIPTYTLPPTVGALPSPGSGGVIDSNDDGVPDKKDPRTMTGKEWSCSTLGASPPRDTVVRAGTPFTVTWTIFNSGTKSWPLTGVDFVYTGGFRHEETRIQDFTRNVPSGGEVRVSASFIAPERPDMYQTFFTLQVGRRQFCGIKYVFYVAEK